MWCLALALDTRHVYSNIAKHYTIVTSHLTVTLTTLGNSSSPYLYSDILLALYAHYWVRTWVRSPLSLVLHRLNVGDSGDRTQLNPFFTD